MTLVKIDIKNVASETHPDDRVVFYSPELREHPNGGLVSTAETVVSLVDGVGDVELVPGPVTVTFQCRGIADTKPKRGTVPDEGPVDLGDVIAGDFVYTPAVVSAAVQARNEAQAAADRAEAGADRVGTAEQVGQWAHDAQGSAESTAADREAVATDRQAVAQDKDSVSALTVRAETAAGDAETHAELAEGQAGIATEASGNASASEQAAAQSASDADSDRVAAEEARARAVQAENTATGAATTATNKATEAGLAADRAELATAGKADLVGGKIPSSQIPEVALTKPHAVSDRTAMLSLPDVQQGDVAIIASGTDQGSYMLGEGDPTVFESWIPLSSGAGGVTSVNGQTGTVNLGAADVGASPVGHTHTPSSIGAAPASHTHTVAQVDGLDVGLAGKADSVHTHTMTQVDGLDAAIAGAKSYADSADTAWSNSLTTRINSRTALFWGLGIPPSPGPPSAVADDLYLDITAMKVYKFT